MNWSNASSNCRIEWHPSRGYTWLLRVLGGLAGLSVIASGLPLALAVPLALLGVGWAWLLAAAESWKRLQVLRVTRKEDGMEATLDGRPVSLLSLSQRGPLLVATFQTPLGPVRLAWWPDTLTPAARRTLRLLKAGQGTSPAALPLMAG